MRRSPFALALFALILAGLVSGATAFAVLDKTVTVDVDGHRQAVRTFARDVAGVLHKAGITVGRHDTVAPGLSASVGDGGRVVVRHGRLLNVKLDGRMRHVWVTALSVDEALDQLGVRAEGAWLSASRSATIPRSGLSLELRTPQRVTVLADGHRRTTTTTAPSVRELLAQLHLRLHRLDHVNVPLTTYPTDGTVVTIDRINQRTVQHAIAIPFRSKQVKTSSLYVGDSKIARYGKPGLRVNTYRLTWKNHKLVHRTLVRSRLKSHPVAQIVQVGTKPRPRYAPSADGLNWRALAYCESGGNPRAVSGNGMYRGLYQFTLSTWHNLGGAGDPIDASVSEQTYRAQLLYRRAGDAAWPACGHYLYT